MTTETQAAFARRNGWARSYISELKLAGRLVLTDAGLVEVEASLIRIGETALGTRPDVAERNALARSESASGSQDAPGAPGAPDEGAGTFAEARLLERRYKALRAKLDYEQQQGLLVPAADVQTQGRQIGALMRAALQTIPDRLSAALAAETDPRRAQALLAAEIDRALATLCDQLERLP